MTRKLVQNKAIPVLIPFNDRRFQDDTDDFDFADDLTLTCDIYFMGCLGNQGCIQSFKIMMWRENILIGK